MLWSAFDSRKHYTWALSAGQRRDKNRGESFQRDRSFRHVRTGHEAIRDTSPTTYCRPDSD